MMEKTVDYFYGMDIELKKIQEMEDFIDVIDFLGIDTLKEQIEVYL